jgi:hypothetical protein
MLDADNMIGHNNLMNALDTIRALATDNDRVQIAEVAGVMMADGATLADVHTALLALQDAGQVVLYRNDVTRSITAYQAKTALMVGGCPRHIVYLA